MCLYLDCDLQPRAHDIVNRFVQILFEISFARACRDTVSTGLLEEKVLAKLMGG